MLCTLELEIFQINRKAKKNNISQLAVVMVDNKLSKLAYARNFMLCTFGFSRSFRLIERLFQEPDLFQGKLQVDWVLMEFVL